MIEAIQHHTSSEVSSVGYSLRHIKPGTDTLSHIDFAHRDDYFMFGLIVQGRLRCTIDFQHYDLSPDSIVVVSPQQVHRFISGNGIEGFMLLADPGLVDDRLRRLFDEIELLQTSVFQAGDYSDLKVLFELISRQENKSVGKNLVKAYIGMIGDKISHQISGCIKGSDRKKELMFRFRNLLRANITKERRPAYYADKLNISNVYLNEIVNSLSGYSASRYIKNEIILMAKRELYYSGENIKTIAGKLGFDDSAYFTRLFSETAGISPTEFRRNLV